MTTFHRAAVRIALVDHAFTSSRDAGVGHPVHEVASALLEAGHTPCIVTAHVGPTRRRLERGIEVVRLRRLPEAPLRLRGFTGPLTHVPSVVGELLRGSYAVAHAFSAPDALAARLWRSAVGRPVAFTPVEPMTREFLSDRRLRMRLVEQAVERSDTVITPSAEVRAGLRRWFALEALEIAPDDALALVEAYRAVSLPSMGGRDVGRVP